MADFVVFDAGHLADRDAWRRVWEQDPDAEVFAHPEYAAAFTVKHQRDACAYYRDPDGEALFAFHLRDVAGEPWAPPGCHAADLVTPYGYGGPFVVGRPSPQKFWAAFTEWAAAAHVVCGFARRSLFPERLLPLPCAEVPVSENVVRSLGDALDKIWMDYEHKVRKNVNKARRAGLATEMDATGARLDDFVRIYAATMERRSASRFYRFDRTFFANLLTRLPGRAILFHVMTPGGDVVSTELVLASSHHIYSFLGGTIADAMHTGANDLLKHAIVEWGSATGKSAFILGGGYRPGDGIFRYKRAFAPTGVRNFCVGRLVFDPPMYAELVSARRAWEASAGSAWEPPGDFFPAFRAASTAPAEERNEHTGRCA